MTLAYKSEPDLPRTYRVYADGTYLGTVDERFPGQWRATSPDGRVTQGWARTRRAAGAALRGTG